MDNSFLRSGAHGSRTVIEVSAGGVIYRGSWPSIEVALTMPRYRTVWTLPKGMIEPGETPEEAALREVREESGLCGRIIVPLLANRYSFFTAGRTVRVSKTVHFYLMECLGGDIEQHDREVTTVEWFALSHAVDAVEYRGERDVLRRAIQTLDSGQ